MLNALKHFYLLRCIEKNKSRLSIKPLNAKIHFNYAKQAARFGLYNLANAELKSAEYLGFDADQVSTLNKRIYGSLTELDELDVNQYQRFKILQTHLQISLNDGDAILDIGGGHGILSQFLPANRYFLIEPSVNGISGLKLPFPDNSFDAVVTCHVLEHINADDRLLFISELVRVAKRKVLVFNPFKNEELDEQERLQLVLEITKAEWAKEHIDCGLPAIEEISDYIASLGLDFTIKGYGDIYASMATVFMSYFAGEKHAADLVKINKHFNQKYDQLSCSKYPTNIMIDITKQ